MTSTELTRVQGLLENLDRLLEGGEEIPAVSLYMPVGGGGRRSGSPERARFEALVDEARARLLGEGMGGEEADRVLYELKARLADRDAWDGQESGLAAFTDGEETTFLEVGVALPERVFVGGGYHLKPLMAVAANVDAYYLLLIAQNHTQLFRGSRLGFRAAECPGLPASYGDWVQGEGFPDESRAGAASDSHLKVDRHNLGRFFAQIDAAVCRRLGGAHDPLILACVGTHVPIYRSQNHYRHLAESFLEGNFEHATTGELHQRALKALHHEFIESQKRALLRFKDLSGQPEVVGDISEIVPAAVRGQVRVLCVPSDTELWGSYDKRSGRVTLADGPGGSAADLYEMAARHALAHGAEVFLLEEAKLPHDRKTLALLRWTDGG